jgi:membrane protein
MAEESKTLDASGSGHEAGREQAAILRSQTEIEKARPSGGPSTLGMRDRLERFERSAAGRYWAHLSTADFMNSSFAFAALSVLSAFPFLAVSSSVLGGDFRTAIVARMGLSDQAKRDIDGLIGTGNQAVATLTWFSAVVLVLGGIGMASTLSTWYHRIYERTPPKGLFVHVVYWTAGVAAYAVYISCQVWLFDLARPVGGQALIFLITFVVSVVFWWWSSYMLLYREVPLRDMFAAGVATGACLTGLGIVSAFFFSDQVTSGQNSYGPAGVVIALITFLVGYGVCLHAGAVFGRMWNERQAERAALNNQVADTDDATTAA